MPRNNSAAYRIAFIYSCAFALAILALGVTVYYAADAQFRDQQDVGIAEGSTLLLREYYEGGIPDLCAAIGKREEQLNNVGYRYALFDPSGVRRAGTLATTWPMAGKQDLIVAVAHGKTSDVRALVTELPGGYRFVTAIDLEAVKRIDAIIFELFTAAFILVIMLGVGGALLLGGYLRGRLSRISGTALAIVAGDLDHRIRVSARNDEFDQLGAILNAMLDRIARLLENLRQVSSDVAHDLRTPLARLRGQIEAALDGDQDAAVLRLSLKRSLAQSDELLSLFAAILRIAEVESGALTRHFINISLSDLATDLYDSYAPAVADTGRTMESAIEPGAYIVGDRELIAQALINLLDNAQRHTPPSTRISLNVKATDQHVTVSVTDNGQGVALAERSVIVQRFARLDASRTTPGHGLGLNLVSVIVEAHGGRLMIDDNAPGLRVSLVLPRQTLRFPNLPDARFQEPI
jgi:signal transduction histidine kinase